MKALSIRAPWWWYILHGGPGGAKDIENRDWSTRYRGPLLIQASKWWNAAEIQADDEFCREINPSAPPAPLKTMHRGFIVGRVDMVGCIAESYSPWFFGPYGFVLANPVAFKKPIPFKGALGLFEVPDGTVPT